MPKTKAPGSPPPMRGKAPDLRRGCWRVRITPAYAGKRLYPAIKPFCDQDHPRLCGEKKWTATTQEKQSGSPPPMRGKAVTGVTAAVAGRITPAYAGKSDFFELSAGFFGGSPPPMRGKGQY